MREAPFQFLWMSNRGVDAGPVPTSVSPRQMKDKLLDVLSAGPAAVVVKNADVPAVLAALGDRVADRGAKHPAVRLTRLVLGQRGILAIRGSYTSAGHMLGSLRTFRRNAIRRGEEPRCIIGVDEGVFEEAWRREPPADADGADRDAPGDPASLLRMLPREQELDRLAELFVGCSPHVRVVRHLIARAAGTRRTVLILGDVGTGKTLAAHCIHELSPGSGPFVSVNGLALNSPTFETVLFGAVVRSGSRGRPTRKPGLWEQAKGGILYLDEIAALSLAQQTRLNDALRANGYRPQGGLVQPLPDAQLVVSSSNDLGARARSGEFLADLYYRLREFTIHTPALRDRPEDVPVLAQVLWTELAGPAARPLPEPVLASLQTYPWPGNVRELKSVLSSLRTLFGDAKLGPRHVEVVMAGQGFDAPPKIARDPSPSKERDRMRCVRHLLRTEEILQSLRHAVRPPAKSRRSAAPDAAAPGIETVGRLLTELDLLFFNPSLFGTVETYTAINALKGKVFYYADLAARDPAAAARFLEKDLAAALAATAADLRATIDRMLD